jgi:peptidoglycan-associated lipoprotein
VTVSKYYFIAVWLMAAAVSPALPGGFTLSARADPRQESPAEMLQDGLEALLDRQRELASRLFEQVMQVFPGTPEARRAERELGLITGAGSEANADQAPTRGSGIGESGLRFTTAELRMKFAVEAGDRVFFAENSAVIGGRARSLLEQQARWLNQRPELKVTIVGRADDGSAPEAARDVSTKRAEAVRDRLVENGVAANRIAIEARGMRDPVATCRSPLCRAQNRHAETIIGTEAAAGISSNGR